GRYGAPRKRRTRPCDSVSNPQEGATRIGDGERHGDCGSYRAPVCAPSRRALLARRRGAARAWLLCRDRAQAADRGRARGGRLPRAPALGLGRAPVLPGAARVRRCGLRDLRHSTQRLARILATAGTVGRRLALRSAWGGDRAHRLCWRVDPGSDRRRPRASADRVLKPDRGPLPVQPSHHRRRRLAHGRDRRPGDGRGKVDVSRSGRDRAGAYSMVHWRGDPDADQPEPSAAIGARAWPVCASGAVAALSPLIANAAQWVAQPFLAIFFSSACAALAQAGLWAIVYLFTGVTLDWLGARPPRIETAWEHWRSGFVRGLIYGALFMGFILIAALILSAPGAGAILDRAALLAGPLGGALAFPLGATIISSADGTPPFFGRLKRAYRDPRGFARGAVVGLGLALAYRANLSASDGGARFLAMAAIGAVAYGGVDLFFDVWAVLRGARVKLQTWRLYALGLLLGGLVAGALGWYFDAPQLKVVIAKFWAYADVNYRLDGRRLGDFTTYPIFNKYGAINLGEVAG